MAPPNNINRFGPEVLKILRAAGWKEGRDTIDMRLFPSTLASFPSARAIVREFGGLHFGSSGRGIDMAKSDIHIDPSLGVHLVKDLARLGKPIGEKLYPLGEVYSGNAYLVVDESGRIYVYYDDLTPIAPSFDLALHVLLLGKKEDEEEMSRAWRLSNKDNQ